jgi:hypothetical protein
LKRWSRKWWIGIYKALKIFGTWSKPLGWNDFGWRPKRFCRMDRKTYLDQWEQWGILS